MKDPVAEGEKRNRIQSLGEETTDIWLAEYEYDFIIEHNT